jgi:hypothetical protein
MDELVAQDGDIKADAEHICDSLNCQKNGRNQNHPEHLILMTVPGIQSYAAIGIISEIGVDMSVFPTSKHLCS